MNEGKCLCDDKETVHSGERVAMGHHHSVDEPDT
jgi:hypothetical protein